MNSVLLFVSQSGKDVPNPEGSDEIVSDMFDQFIDHVSDRFSEVGLIGEFASIGANELVQGSMEDLLAGIISEKDAIENDLIDFELLISFIVTEGAWTKEVLDPEGHEIDQEFRRAVPPENEIVARSFLEAFGE